MYNKHIAFAKELFISTFIGWFGAQLLPPGIVNSANNKPCDNPDGLPHIGVLVGVGVWVCVGVCVGISVSKLQTSIIIPAK